MMPMQRIERHDNSPVPDAGQIATFLVARGLVLGPGGISVGPLPDGWFAVADVDRDPAPDAAAFTPTPDPLPQAVAYLGTRVDAITAISPGNRTIAERDLLAVATVLRRIVGGR